MKSIVQRVVASSSIRCGGISGGFSLSARYWHGCLEARREIAPGQVHEEIEFPAWLWRFAPGL